MAPLAPEIHPAARPRRWLTALRLLLPLGVVLTLLALVAGGLVLGTRWLIATEGGTRWLLGALPGVQVEGMQGQLLGDRLRADRFRFSWHQGRAWVEIEGLELSGMAWHWRPQAGIWLGLEVEHAQARRVTVDSGPPTPTPLRAPSTLAAPLHARVGEAHLSELRLNSLEPITSLAARTVVFDGRAGEHHTVEQLALRAYGWALGGEASIGNQSPLPVHAQVTVVPALHAGAAPPWAAVLFARGPLETLDVTAILRGVAPRAGAAAPQAELQAHVRPLNAWPVAQISARTEALDLSAIAATAPQTHLSGRVEAAAPRRDAPISAHGEIENRLPGRWNEGRLPVARMQFELRGALEPRDRVEAPRFEVELADAAGAAGRVSGRALWTGHRLELDARLSGLMPQRLDGRAAAMTLSGPLQATLAGLPSPDPKTQADRPPWHLETQVDLEGRLEGAPSPVRLSAAGGASAQRIEVKQLRAQAGAAVAELKAALARPSGRGDWQLTTTGSLANFEPLPWWPGDPGSAWRQGVHRINASWQLDLRLPQPQGAVVPLVWAQRLAGNGRLRVQQSLLAGVPISADIALSYAQAAAPAPGSVRIDVDVGGNQVQAEGRGDPTGTGASDRIRVQVQAPTLATLAPLARLHPALAEWVPRQGSVSGSFAADGRWPVLRSEGSARVEQLLAGTLKVNRAAARWSLHLGPTVGDEPLSVTAEVTGVQLGAQRASQLRAELRGTAAEHRIELVGALPFVPPALAGQLFGIQVQRGTRSELLAHGQWQADPAGGGRWRSRIEYVALGPWDGESASSTAPLTRAWAEARDLRAELAFDRQGSLATLRAEPGRLQVADAVALRWDEVRADFRREPFELELRADIEPFALAPLLARAMPGMGWRGDLRLAARVAVKATERFEADLAFERRDGDLYLSDEAGVQPFGLTEFRVALTARDGVWDFSPRFNGRSLGEVRGTLRTRTAAERRWPDADAAIEGEVVARVADLAIWSSWVPPGWRLAGELRTTATVGGRFGSPTYTGEITGTGIAVRHLLRGVNVSDGELRVVLAGESAQIERFSARAGDGRVNITGGAQFGTKPAARVQLDADRFRVLGRVDRQLVASGKAELVLGTAAGRLDGSFRVDEGLFDFSSADAPSLDEDVYLRSAEDAELPEDATGSRRPQRDFVLGVDLDLGEHLRVRGRGLDSGLAGKVRITNPGGRLAVNGTIRTENGQYAAYGQKLEIERGLVAFGGPVADPRLDILAIRPNLDVKVGVLITGTAQLPRVRLYSDPDMGDTDKLSWLLLGRAPDGLGKDDAAMLQRAALALLAGEGGAPTDALMKNLGIDELSVRQSDSETRETVITLGKQLSRRWYVGYERGVNSTTGTWQLIYRVAQRLTIRAQSGLDNSLDVIWVWRFQEAPPEGGVRKSLPALPP